MHTKKKKSKNETEEYEVALKGRAYERQIDLNI